MNNSETDIKMGTLYDINKAAIAMEKPLKKIELKDKLRNIKPFLAKYPDQYFMLLCRERYDFTIFNFCNGKTDFALSHAIKDLEECLMNRGKTVSIELVTGSKNAYEIWLIIDDQAYVYYLFPYDIGVLEQ